MVNNRQAGKNLERSVAKRMGGKRVGILGKEDISCGPWSIEAKKRKAFVGCKYMEQAVRNCPAGKTPIVIVHMTSQRHGKDLVMMRFRDFEEWFGKLDLEKRRG